MGFILLFKFNNPRTQARTTHTPLIPLITTLPLLPLLLGGSGEPFDDLSGTQFGWQNHDDLVVKTGWRSLANSEAQTEVWLWLLSMLFLLLWKNNMLDLAYVEPLAPLLDRRNNGEP
ncbi:hypothetical protein AAHE18_03G352000 [Arachis hypogaea]